MKNYKEYNKNRNPYIDNPYNGKICYMCKNYKTLEFFSKNPNRKDGLNSSCKECSTKYLKNYFVNIKKNNEYINPFLDQEKTKICSECKINKQLNEFYKNSFMTDGLHNKCKNCSSDIQKITREKHKELYTVIDAYNNGKKHKICLYCKENKDIEDFYKNSVKSDGLHDECIKCLIQRSAKYQKCRRKNDLLFNFRQQMSKQCNAQLKINGSSKNGVPFWQNVDYTPKELWEHLQKCSTYEPWMIKDTHGRYNRYRQTWQVDHKIAHTSFDYKSLQDEDFEKCWKLENLQPLRADLNQKKSNKTWDQFLIDLAEENKLKSDEYITNFLNKHYYDKK
jgi:hypothetical protein